MLLCGLLLVGLPFFALAQTATLVGTVTDPSGSVVPNVTITATHVETGLVRGAKASDSGQYVLADLPIGHYTVKAEASGFGIAQRNDVVLNVGDRARIDFALKMGAATETITVEADAVRVQTDSGEVGSVITGQQVTQLATNGRSMYSLANLTPGAASGQADFQIPTPVGGDAAMSFYGQRQSHNLYMLDGSESSDRGGGGGSDVMPSMDSIAEFRMLTSNYSAEFGLSSAATMTAVIRSGGKQFHASAWEFLRNDALDARNYFNPAPAKVAELRSIAEHLRRQLWQHSDHSSDGRAGFPRDPGAICSRRAYPRSTLPQQHHSGELAGSQRAGPAGGGHFPEAHQR